MRIIPAIDLIDGKCVRLEQGDYSKQKTYAANPLDMAKSFEDHGLRYLHLVDLDGAKAGKLQNWKVLAQICQHTQLTVDIGGGIKTQTDVDTAFAAGAAQINVGSLAVKSPEVLSEWIVTYGAEKIILSADVKSGLIAINGWQQVTDIPIKQFIGDYLQKGITYITCTDIAKDGMLQGTSTDLYKELLLTYPHIKLNASGGVGSIEDLVALSKLPLHGAIIGKAIYEGQIALSDLRDWHKAQL